MKTLEEILIYPAIDWVMRTINWNYKPFDEATAKQQSHSLPCDVIVGELHYALHISLNCTIEQAENAYRMHKDVLEQLHAAQRQEVS